MLASRLMSFSFSPVCNSICNEKLKIKKKATFVPLSPLHTTKLGFKFPISFPHHFPIHTQNVTNEKHPDISSSTISFTFFRLQKLKIKTQKIKN